MEYYLIYVSTADHLMAENELLAILERSRKWNMDHGITGMLIYIEGIFARIGSREVYSELTGRFMQVLEGSQEEVERIFNCIQTDARHHSIMVLQKSSLSSRNFESWQMGFKSITLDEFKMGSADFDLDQSFASSTQAESSNLPLQFLKSFYHRGTSPTSLFTSQRI